MLAQQECALCHPFCGTALRLQTWYVVCLLNLSVTYQPQLDMTLSSVQMGAPLGTMFEPGSPLNSALMSYTRQVVSRHASDPTILMWEVQYHAVCECVCVCLYVG